jgi:predicted deacylase
VGEFTIGGNPIAPGSRADVELTVGTTTLNEPVHLRLRVVCGRKPGPVMLVCACIHGDEINGVEIVRRLMRSSSLRALRGTLLAVPIVNVPAFTNRSRYLPDRRDLNRLFPGSPSGSLGARLAHVFCREIVSHCDTIIDLHTGATNRPNLPQVRITEGDTRALELARVFNAPVTLAAGLRPASLREVAADEERTALIFESGEALRLDAASIRFGLRGVLSTMRHIGMLPERRTTAKAKARQHPTVVCRRSSWERAPVGGLFTPLVSLGKAVTCESVLGFVADPYGTGETPVMATRDGIVIARTNEGQVDEGDALFHIASARDPGRAEDKITSTAEGLPNIPADEDDHPVPYDPFTDVI